MSATAAIIAPDAPIRRQVVRDSNCAKSALVARSACERGIGSVIGAVVVAIFLFLRKRQGGREIGGGRKRTQNNGRYAIILAPDAMAINRQGLPDGCGCGGGALLGFAEV